MAEEDPGAEARHRGHRLRLAGRRQRHDRPAGKVHRRRNGQHRSSFSPTCSAARPSNIATRFINANVEVISGINLPGLLKFSCCEEHERQFPPDRQDSRTGSQGWHQHHQRIPRRQK
ncbi:MAG: hypothetical protein MZV63_33610 [Marinilabiliales bacterium]|nr:hypothetical protein [Marinilabiliales bacterium]